jgi:hypothetical protein
VPLLSPRFLASEWCRFEWESFSQRAIRRRGEPAKRNRAETNAAIVPVNWTAIPTSQLPPAIAAVQAFALQPTDGTVQDSYRTEGVLGLLTMGMDRDCRVVAWRLGRRIVEIVQEYEVAVRVPADTTGLGKTFKEDSP